MNNNECLELCSRDSISISDDESKKMKFFSPKSKTAAEWDPDFLSDAALQRELKRSVRTINW